jgi:coenzyme Q-binding protein COQ10
MEGELEIGWGGYEEKFRSRVYCVPERLVEAVGGDAMTSVGIADRMEFESNDRAAQPETNAGIELSAQEGQSQILSHLLTRWSIKPFPFKPPPEDATPQEGKALKPTEPRTEVNLVVEFKFASPIYAALSQAVAPKITGIMIEAFEKRAQEVLGGSRGDVVQPEVESLRMKP